MAQMIDGLDAGRRQLRGILIIEPAQIECAQRCEAHTLGEQIRRIQRGQIIDAAQMALAIGKQCMTSLGDCATKTDRGHHVLQCASAPHVHVHGAGCDQWKSVALAKCVQIGQACGIVEVTVQFDRDPRVHAEMLCDPARVRVVRIVRRIQQAMDAILDTGCNGFPAASGRPRDVPCQRFALTRKNP